VKEEGSSDEQRQGREDDGAGRIREGAEPTPPAESIANKTHHRHTHNSKKAGRNLGGAVSGGPNEIKSPPPQARLAA